LGSVALNAGCDVRIVDFNLKWHRSQDLGENFWEVATNEILEADAHIYGFTSMAVDS
jgi:hypothetical protein